ncbi:hypothetical protein [Mesorhizobium australicum]|uniref:Uncharacterized protein n=1 Tax=Mesorhizobium australicum TaxID=536018 RepID=A0A1X7MQI5_9HYPH|nr:hypothetical protein [Mesorhizobium australicum]SMH26296.1 hypothetical protein SAMN02982922_0139 [Mesorhizobium australicum]
MNRPQSPAASWWSAISLFAVRYGIVHCNIRGGGYHPAIGHLLLPDAMPMLDMVHLLPAAGFFMMVLLGV